MVTLDHPRLDITNQNGTAGYIRSIQPYKDESICVWNVKTKCQNVKYVIDEIDIEYSSECHYDFVNVTSETHSEKYCGKQNGMIGKFSSNVNTQMYDNFFH